MEEGYLRIAGGLIVLLGVGCGLGAATLWSGAPESWGDVVATETIVRRTAKVLAAVSSMLVVAGVTCLLAFRWASVAGAIATLLFVAGGFLGNYVLFGNLRLRHTGTNLVVALAIIWLLWSGTPQ